MCMHSAAYSARVEIERTLSGADEQSSNITLADSTNMTLANRRRIEQTN